MKMKLDIDQAKDKMSKTINVALTERAEYDRNEMEALLSNKFKRRTVIGLNYSKSSNGPFLSKLDKFIDVKKTRHGALSHMHVKRGETSHLDILNQPGETQR